MEQNAWLGALTAVTTVLSALIGVVAGGMRRMWNKMNECEKGHRECREGYAALEKTNEYQAGQILEIQSVAVRSEVRADKAEKDAAAAHEKIRQIEGKLETVADSVTKKPGC